MMRYLSAIAAPLAATALASCFDNRTAEPSPAPPPQTERTVSKSSLLNAASPFDRSFADTAVWWHTWGDAAFAEASASNRPVFLFIGYPSCPWCSKMRRSFSDPEIAELINRNFVPVLVDAQALPGVNRVFMRYLEATRQQSGWPLCVWLTPDRLPITAGNYFPETTDGTSPAFLTVLEHVSKQWQRFPDHYRRQTRRDLGALVEKFDSFETPSAWEPSPAILDETYTKLSAAFDPVSGGFGSAPKFPAPLKLRFLLRYAQRFPEGAYQREKATRMVVESLDQLIASSTHDHLAGGFFRYSQHASWNSPNFEKMLDDQALLATALLGASAVTGETGYADLARRTLDFAIATFAVTGGGFASALSADSPPHDAPGAPASVGLYYTWTPAEIAAALGDNPDKATTATGYYHVTARGNIPLGSNPHGDLDKRSTLYKTPGDPAPPAEIASIDAALLAARQQRPAPARDELVVLEWNALLVSALVAAAAGIDEPSYLTRASDLATFLLESFGDPASGVLRRTMLDGVPANPATAGDYAALVAALLDLHSAAPEAGWLGRALPLQEAMDKHYYDADRGGYWDIAERNTLFYNLKPTIDGTRPSANAVAVMNLVRLAGLTGDQAHLARALATLRSRHKTLSAALDLSPALNLAIMDYLGATASGAP